MIWVIALAVWTTLLVGARLAMSRDLFRVVVGLALISSGIVLMLFSSGRVSSAEPAVIAAGEKVLPATAANPLPQALVLTAIVIGFALICFAFILVVRVVRDAETDDAEDLRYAEPAPTHAVEPPASPEGCDPRHPLDEPRTGGHP
ncbi:MAG: cation:proton antiporter [Phycisphaera sp.]|nr:cation:proton antiporter [Phycisphaera sp.]